MPERKWFFLEKRVTAGVGDNRGTDASLLHRVEHRSSTRTPCGIALPKDFSFFTQHYPPLSVRDANRLRCKNCVRYYRLRRNQ